MSPAKENMNELKIRKTWDELKNSLLTSPEYFGSSFLHAFGTFSEAEDGMVVLTSQKKERPDSPIEWKKRASYPDYQEAIANFLSSGDDIRETDLEKEPFCRMRMHRLVWNQKTIGAVVLFFKADARPGKEFTPFLLFYSLYEYLREVLELLDLSQKGLKALSAESAEIAKEHSHLLKQMLSNQKRLQSISKGILRTQEEERSKISRELHDGVGQALTALNMNLDHLANRLRDRIAPEEMERLQEARSIAEQSLQDVRELSRLLRPRMLDDLGLYTTLQWYVRNFSKRVGIPVKMELEGEETLLTAEIQTILFRIAQEALTNIAKHSQADTATLSITVSENRVTLKVTDNGSGFRASDSRSEASGLSGIRDRVSLFGGIFRIDSDPARGTTLLVEVPFNGQD